MVVYAPVCFGAQDAHEVIEHKGEESLITAFAAFTLFCPKAFFALSTSTMPPSPSRPKDGKSDDGRHGLDRQRRCTPRMSCWAFTPLVLAFIRTNTQFTPAELTGWLSPPICVWGSLSSWAQSPVGLDDALYATDYPRCTHRI